MSVRADLHTTEGLQRYINGMNASMPDKARIIPHVKKAAVSPLSAAVTLPFTVLELGCGSGAVLELLSKIPEKPDIFGLDFSARLLGEAGQRNYNSRVTLIRANILNPSYISEIENLQFDAIVACSILHEIWSQLMNSSKMGMFLKEWSSFIKPGGSFIIRDGCKPPQNKVKLRFRNHTVYEKFFRFVEDFTPSWIPFQIDPSDQSVLVNAYGLYEFLTKYFYDENWDVEVKEQFGWANRDLMEKYASAADLNLHLYIPYTLPFLEDKWKNDFDMSCDGELYIPKSTALTVLHKPYSVV